MEERGRPDGDDKGILDTVRRILGEDKQQTPDVPGDARRTSQRPLDDDDDVLELESTMMIDSPPPANSRQAVPEGLVGDKAEQIARHSLGSLRTVMRERRALLTHRGGPSIEDIIRDEMRPLLREWLDANLPQLVEQLVRAEIARIVEREGA